MMRHLLTGALVSVLGAAWAAGGEDAALQLETGMSMGAQKTELFSKNLEWNTAVFLPCVRISRLEEGPGFSLRARGLFAADNDLEANDRDFETRDMHGFDLQALVGWGFRPMSNLAVTPLAGLTFQHMQAEIKEKGGDLRYDCEHRAVSLDMGVRAEGNLSERLSLSGQWTFGPVIGGRAHLTAKDAGAGLNTSNSEDLDVHDQSIWSELQIGLDWRFDEQVSLSAGWAYEHLHDQAEKSGLFEQGGKTEIDRNLIRIGLAVRF